jgi:hypothetical protein
MSDCRPAGLTASVYLEAGKGVRNSICLPASRYRPAVIVSIKEVVAEAYVVTQRESVRYCTVYLNQ